MKEITSSIQYKGREIKLIFDLNVLEELQAKYGSYAAWQKKCYGDGDTEVDIAALKYVFFLMINEQIDIDNEDNGTEEQPVTLKQVGRILTEIGLQNVAGLIEETITRSTESTEKNG